MKKILLGIVIGAFALMAYQRVHDPVPVAQSVADPMQPELQFVEKPDQHAATSNDSANFSCDGRVHCSQMNSCEEATLFVRNCPDVKMDGDNDGKPCEERCGH